MGGSGMEPPTLPPRPHGPPTRATRTVPRTASAAVWHLPPTGAEVLEGGLTDIAFDESAEVPGGPWGWPGGSDHRRRKFQPNFRLLLRGRRGKTHKTAPNYVAPCIDESEDALGGALRRREQKP